MMKLLRQFFDCPCKIRARTLVASLLAGILATLPAARLQAAGVPQNPPVQPANTFVILLSGPYTPVPVQPLADCNNFGLAQVDVCDGSFAVNRIFPISGLLQTASSPAIGSEGPLSDERQAQNAIGHFYVEFAGPHAAYDLPGGAMTMVFTGQNLTPVPDGQGGVYIVGTIQLNITEATGVYAPFLGGHNDMVDILHQLADGTFVEHCYCVISRPAPPAAALQSEEGRSSEIAAALQASDLVTAETKR